MPEDFSVAQLQLAMQNATEDIKREMTGLIDSAAQSMLNRVQQRFPAGPTGNLRSMVRVTASRPSVGTLPGKKVRGTAPHIHMWEEGTRLRTDATRGNANRGRMPAGGRVFETAAAETRGNMLRRAQDMLNRNREL